MSRTVHCVKLGIDAEGLDRPLDASAKTTAIRKTVRRDIEDTHDAGGARKIERAPMRDMPDRIFQRQNRHLSSPPINDPGNLIAHLDPGAS